MIILVKRISVALFFILLFVWISQHLKGLEAEKTKNGDTTVSFNWHAILISVSFLLFMGEGVFAFRQGNGVKLEPGNADRPFRKNVHMVSMGLAIVSGAVGLALIGVNHNDHGFANFYSVHSWFGVATLGLVALQFVVGFYFFWWTKAHQDLKKRRIPFHRIGGQMIFFAGLCTMALGIFEKLTFISKYLGNWSASSMWAGALALLLLPLAMLMGFAFAIPFEADFVPIAASPTHHLDR